MEEIKKETKPIAEVKSVKDIPFYARIQKVRAELSKNELSKSGKNGYSNYKYFELKDFSAKADELFEKYGVMPWFTLEMKSDLITKSVPKDENEMPKYEYKSVEYAKLVLYDAYSTNSIESSCRTVEADVKGTSAIQAAGAKHTYYRRYLYIDALNIAESDAVDGDEPTDPNAKGKPKSVKDTPKTAEKKEEEPVTEDTSMTDKTKAEISKYIKEKGFTKPVPEVIKIAAEKLGVNVAYIKEMQKEGLIEIIDDMSKEEVA